MSTSTGKRSGTYQYFVADPVKPAVGTRMNWERGDMRRDVFGKSWSATPTQTSRYDSDPELAEQVSNAVLDAFRAFLLLGIAPGSGPTFIQAPDRLAIDSDEGHWAFDRATAPKQALAVYEAALKVLPVA